MVRRLLITAMLLGLAGSSAGRANAQTCDLAETLDPKAATTVVSGSAIWPGWAIFSSPENTDPDLVWYVGDPGTLDGCISGIAPGSGAPTGALEMPIDFLFCFGVDVETSMPYTAQLFDPGGALVSTVTGTSPTYDLSFRGETWLGYRIVLTPGDLPGGGRDALCVDNLRAVYGEVPVVPRTWGKVKAIYR